MIYEFFQNVITGSFIFLIYVFIYISTSFKNFENIF